MIATLFFWLLSQGTSCRGTTGPPDDTDSWPRNLAWSIDTLAYPGSFQTMMSDIWGSDPNNVYVVGHNERGYGKMYHYDGLAWTDVGLINAVDTFTKQEQQMTA